jgi:hypothetical protein
MSVKLEVHFLNLYFTVIPKNLHNEPCARSPESFQDGTWEEDDNEGGGDKDEQARH